MSLPPTSAGSVGEDEGHLGARRESSRALEARPDPTGSHGAGLKDSQKPELRGTSVVVMKAAEHRASHHLDRGVLWRRA